MHDVISLPDAMSYDILIYATLSMCCRLEAVRLENRGGLRNIAMTLMAKG